MAKKKQTLKRKYRRRRALLMVFVFALMGAGGFFLGRMLYLREPPESKLVLDAPEGASQPVSAASAQPADDGKWMLILVNEANPLPEDYRVTLMSITPDCEVDARIGEPLMKMFAAAKEDGINLQIASAYRSVEYQEGLVRRSIEQYMAQGKTRAEAEAQTAMWIASPGISEHHTGLAVDINSPEYAALDYGFARTRAFAWLDEHAHEYGFVMRYPANKVEITKIDYEPWHYRYVGEAAAAEIKDMKVCLEEYIYMKETFSTKPPKGESDLDEPLEETESEAGEKSEA